MRVAPNAEEPPGGVKNTGFVLTLWAPPRREPFVGRPSGYSYKRGYIIHGVTKTVSGHARGNNIKPGGE